MGLVDISTELAGIVNDLTNDADDVSGALSKIIAQVNGNIDSTNIKAGALLTATTHGNLSASTATLHSAASSSIVDAGDYFTATNVEAALQEVGASAAIVAESGSITATATWPQTVIKTIDDAKYVDIIGRWRGVDGSNKSRWIPLKGSYTHLLLNGASPGQSQQYRASCDISYTHASDTLTIYFNPISMYTRRSSIDWNFVDYYGFGSTYDDQFFLPKDSDGSVVNTWTTIEMEYKIIVIG